MGIREIIASSIGLTGFDILKGQNVRRWHNNYRVLLEGTRESIELYRLSRLKELLVHAFRNTEFYNKRMVDAGFDPYRFSSVEELKRLPVLSREDLQTEWPKIISTIHDKRKIDKGSSSGSTGIPVTFFQDPDAQGAGLAANMIGWSFAGWRLGYKGLHIWGNPSTVNDEWKKTGSRIKAILFNHEKFAAYKLTDAGQFKILANRLVKEEYDFIDGYTNTIFLLAEYIKEFKVALPRRLKMVLTTAENLQDFQRSTIEEILGPVYDTYGCSEINAIAYECRHCRRYHIIEPHVIVEFGEDVYDDMSRELIVTDLDNYAFPLIRYRNHDLAVQTPDSINNCRIPLKSIDKISGRESDIIKLQGGGTLSIPSFFGSMLLKKVKGIKQYQIVLERKDFLSIHLVKSEAFTEMDLKILDTSVSEYLNGRIGYEIKFVDVIEVSPNGKFKLLVDRRTA